MKPKVTWYMFSSTPKLQVENQMWAHRILQSSYRTSCYLQSTLNRILWNYFRLILHDTAPANVSSWIYHARSDTYTTITAFKQSYIPIGFLLIEWHSSTTWKVQYVITLSFCSSITITFTFLSPPVHNTGSYQFLISYCYE